MIGAERRMRLIETVREAARAHILPRFRALAPGDVSTKSGPGDLVTRADTETEAAIARGVARFWPEATVLGEEGVAADPAARQAMAGDGPIVIVDPVDGTWNFAKGLALFGVIVAVAEAARPVWAMLYDPVLDDWVEAGAGEARLVSPRRDVPLATSAEARVGRMQGYVSLGLLPRGVRPQVAAEFPAFSRVTSLRCSCHEYRMVSQGHADFLLSGALPHPWDHAAGVLAVQAAGGIARFIDGSPYEIGRERGTILAAGSEKAWERVAERFAFLA